MTSSATVESSVDLSTRYLGLHLPHPFMPGASPMADDLGTVRRLEDAGAAAIVMHSLFEEQVEMEQGRTLYDIESNVERILRGELVLPAPGGLSPRPRRLPEPDPPHQAGGEGAGDRLAQRHHRERLAGIRAVDRAGRRRRARAQRLLRGHRSGGGRCHGGAPHHRHHPRSQAGGPYPDRRQALALLLFARAFRGRAGSGGRRRDGAVQPLLPAGHRHRGARSAQLAAPVEFLRTAPAAELAGDPVGAAQARPRGRPAACTRRRTPSRR